MIKENQIVSDVKPLCPVFGECGGCQYQNISYAEELRIKESALKAMFEETLKIDGKIIEAIVASPREYYYRNRIDLRLVKNKANEVFVGFTPGPRSPIIPIDACAIALRAISDAIPAIKQEVKQTLLPRYRNANVVIRAGEDGRVRYGGIGRKSLTLHEEDYFWIKINGRKIFYSLDTFFQANLSILPSVIDRLSALPFFDAPYRNSTTFLDLYGGVGFFGICLADKVQKVILIEESVHSLKLAHHNVRAGEFSNVEIVEGTVEEKLPVFLGSMPAGDKVAMIDPPRAGLSPSARTILCASKNLDHLLYLSCHPETLVRDLRDFLARGWEISKVIPFDFFPRTKHIE